jgi:hypothetical protein
MINPVSEVDHLLDLMPASGRMYCKLVSKPEQSTVIDATLPFPWQPSRPITINFDLWGELPRPQRDLLLLRTVCWLTAVTWLKPNLLNGLVVAGLLGTVVELVQADAVGTVVAATLTAFAGTQLWRNHRSPAQELAADEAAIEVALRRGYTEVEAARHLLAAIASVAQIEGRPGLSFTELIRSQNLRAIAGLSPVGVPETLRQP